MRGKGASRPRRFTCFNDVTISIDLTLRFWQSPEMTRLLVEIVIIAGLIAFGWNKPYKDWTDQTYKKITATLDHLGGDLQKNQDSSVRRY